MDTSKIKEDLIAIKVLADERLSKYISWFRNIITTSVALLGILVSLKPEKFNSLYDSILFNIAISTLALGILFGVILLYSEMHILDKTLKERRNLILKKLNNEHKEVEMIWIQRGKLYNIIEIVCFSSYIISLISLVGYSICSSF